MSASNRISQWIESLSNVGLLPLLRRFKKETNGNIAIMFMICLVPVVAGAGIAIDLSRALIVRERLASALDMAALAVGGTPGLNDQQRQELAEAYFNANYPAHEIGVPSTISVTSVDPVVTISGSADVPTTLLGIFGYDNITVNTNTEVTRESKGLEVVMVLDNTGSMSGSKISALRTAATDLVDILFGENNNPELLKIGLVPFAASVNTGTSLKNEGWMDENNISAIWDDDFDFAPNQTVWDLFNEIPNRSWEGCVQTRKSPEDVKDSKPKGSKPNRYWLPFFAPDEPSGNSNYSNSYLSDGMGGSYYYRQRYTGKYNGASAYNSYNSWGIRGPGNGCTVDPLTPLTNDKDTLLDAIDDMGASGYTHIPVGLAWGWRVISPKKPFNEGVGYNNEEWNKALILLTDGANTIPWANTHNGSHYTAYGYLANGRLGSTNYNTAVAKLDTNTTTLCNGIKAKDIRVYTITFQVSSNSIRDLMRDCATEPELYFDSPSNEALQATFKAIAKDLSNLRISK